MSPCMFISVLETFFSRRVRSFETILVVTRFAFHFGFSAERVNPTCKVRCVRFRICQEKRAIPPRRFACGGVFPGCRCRAAEHPDQMGRRRTRYSLVATQMRPGRVIAF